MGKVAKWLVGIDEAGRGPLAGPVAVGVAMVAKNFDWKLIPGVGDSKMIKEENREAIFLLDKQLKKEKLLDFSVVLIGAKVIDRFGITQAVRQGIARGLKKIDAPPNSSEVRLDGLLSAPPGYENQETIIKGDSKEKIIGLASILAKVTRDRHMVKVAKKYPQYELAKHKGYGTLQHRFLLEKYGLSAIHRQSFCRKLNLKNKTFR